VAQLLIDREGDVRVFDLRDAEPCVIGRSREATIQLDDPSLSRRHCEVSKFDARWMLRDLGSVNGTFCNNMAITTHFLRAGDRIQLGNTVITFTQPDENKRAAAAAAIADTGDAVYEPTGTDLDSEISRKLRNFQNLLEITKAVNSARSKEQLLGMIIDAAIELTSAQRGFLVLITSGEVDFNRSLDFQVARDKNKQAVAEPEKLISKSVIANVVQTGEPVVTLDAQADLQAMSATIANLDIRSLLCAPLKVHEKVVGCVYVDSAIGDVEFGPEQLNLLQAFSDQAAVAIENQRLYEEMMQSREQEKRVRQIFQKYVPADVVRRALEMPDVKKLSAKQVVTVLFSDIRGFTSMSERMEPEQVVAFLNDYLQRMVAIVIEEGGIVDKFIGDAVMAVFGAPFPRPDDPVRAVRAASRMLTDLEAFNRDQAGKPGGVNIRIGVGLHTGPVIAGNIGSDKKMEYTVIGDTVNIASRVESLTKELGVDVIVTQGTYDATRRRIPVKALPPVHVKGKEHALQVYALLKPGEAPAASPTAAGMPIPVPARALPPRPMATPQPGDGLDASTLPRRPYHGMPSKPPTPIAGIAAPPESVADPHAQPGTPPAGAGLDAPTLPRRKL
jgi:adenylate cyclase